MKKRSFLKLLSLSILTPSVGVSVKRSWSYSPILKARDADIETSGEFEFTHFAFDRDTILSRMEHNFRKRQEEGVVRCPSDYDTVIFYNAS